MADEKGTRAKLKELFEGMMKVLYKQEGATFQISILEEPQVQNFIEGHTDTLNSAIEQVPLSDTMRRSLEKSNYMFSGMKTFHELHEAFPKLIDENGEKKSFNRFLNDVQKIDKTYNENYLRAEYNFAHASASMAERWESFDDGDNYLLQYRTANDGKVREEHAQMHGITLPKSDSFWDTFFPPNGWNCRCTAVEVRKGKYPQTPHSEAISRAEQAMTRDKRGMFQFNPGKERKTFPDYNPYTIRDCRNCNIAKGKIKLDFLPTNTLCEGCRYIHKCYEDKEKTQASVLKNHYMHEMEPLLQFKQMMPIKDGKFINVGFSKVGNKHLYSDTFGRSKVLRKEDLKTLNRLLKKATYIDENNAHGHKYDIECFYYYQTKLHGHKIRLNVAKEVKNTKNGFVRIKYYLYSINDIME